MKTGLFIGRFQPFHLGHLSAIRQALKKVEVLYIGIGSAQKNFQKENPFTGAERVKMVKGALKEAKIPLNRFRIILIPDIDDFPAWPGHVRSLVPPFQTVFTGSPIVKELFEQYDTAEVLPVQKKLKISATQIRNEMVGNGDWKKGLPPAIVRDLQLIDGIKRLKQIYGSKEHPPCRIRPKDKP